MGRLFHRAGAAAAIFGFIMAVAHIGPTIPWVAVVKIAVAMGIFAGRWRCPDGQRWHPWSSRPKSFAASPHALSSLWLVSTTYIFQSAIQARRDQRAACATRPDKPYDPREWAHPPGPSVAIPCACRRSSVANACQALSVLMAAVAAVTAKQPHGLPTPCRGWPAPGPGRLRPGPCLLTGVSVETPGSERKPDM